ncbi:MULTISPECIES: helix-turn-helix transcriptional regulator [Bacillus]|uniref:Transcriptional regulator n=2 Tax=Bacillus TaxID=1386 RepID=A0A0M3R8V7_9BACI|nr:MULTISPECIES: YafY family protein [Bacillus]ALC80352.1 transcriptional regulator [Bacillus gobiensis]MBP1083804.1 putative DNA-binding transcriptional regulator YafY [Bacillus capparidis]MED1098289.1 YafY family protein [Bacillus capparidis]
MRGDRLISIILNLQNKGRLTTKELAEQLEVSERTIHRDMEALSRSGIPVVADRGKRGGWRLLDNYETKLTGLKETEIGALFIGPSLHLLHDLGLANSSKEARNKLIASLPSIYREYAKSVWERIYIDNSTWKDKKEKVDSFEILKEAIWNDNQLKILHRKPDGEIKESNVNPLGLVAKGSVWYLIASRSGVIRSYRASRIMSATPLQETFIRPIEFNLADYWEESKKEFIEKLPSYQVEAEAAPSIIPRLRFTGRFIQSIEVEELSISAWKKIAFTFDTEEEAAAYLLGYGDQIKVNKPKQLQEKIRKMAEAVVELYEEIKTDN